MSVIAHQLQNIEKELVFLDEYNISGTNYYWENRKRLGFTDEELIALGIVDNRVRVHPALILPLWFAQADFSKAGYELFIKEGYRPEALYRLVYQRTVAEKGQDTADQLFNMQDMPHSNGMSVDVTLRQAGEEIYFRRAIDGVNAMFVDFYQDAKDALGREYYELQKYLIQTMQHHGFRLGGKREYWHFDYRPDTLPNYP